MRRLHAVPRASAKRSLVMPAPIAHFAGANFVMMEMPFYREHHHGSLRFNEYTRVMEALGFIPFDIIEMHRTATSASHPYGYLFQIDILFV